MLEINNLKIIKKQNNRILIDNFNFVLHKNDKVAIIGEEGNGKSSLLKFIYDKRLIEDYCLVSGNVVKNNLKLGYLEQIIDDNWQKQEVINYFLKDNYDSEIDFNKYNELENVYNMCSKLNLGKDIIEENRLIESLSGGERVKLQLVKIMLSDPDVLLLDEPSNDLDIETLLWLENFIKTSNKPIIYISHDETLLENTCNAVIHLEQIMKKTQAKHTICRLSYREYINQRLKLIDRQNSIADKEKNQLDEKMDKWRKIYQRVDHEQATISRNDAHGGYLLKKKMHAVKSQERMLKKEKENLTKKIDTEDSISILFNYDIEIPKSKVVYNKTISPLCVGDKILSKRVDLVVKGNSHVVITGNNGSGKTTFLKKIYEDIKQGPYKVGYMPQNYNDKLELDSSVIEFVCKDRDKDNLTLARTFLGSMKFSEEEMEGKISELSGGQKAKLLLVKLILDKSQILILDEPTRNLSPLSNPVIRQILSEYCGCIISVSHDRKFIEKVGNVVYKLDEAGLKLIN